MTRIKSKFLPRHKEDWTSGVSLIVTHNLGGDDILVQITNKNNNQLIMVDTVEFTDNNTVTLTASEAPTGSGWRVIMLKL